MTGSSHGGERRGKIRRQAGVEYSYRSGSLTDIEVRLAALDHSPFTDVLKDQMSRIRKDALRRYSRPRIGACRRSTRSRHCHGSGLHSKFGLFLMYDQSRR